MKKKEFIKKTDATTPQASNEIQIKPINNKDINKNGEVFIFFTKEEATQLTRLINILVPQTHEFKFIRIAEILDQDFAKKTARNSPWVRRFYKRGLAKLGSYCPNLSTYEIEDILDRENGDFLKIFIQKVMQDSIKIYYSHTENQKAVQKIGSFAHLPFIKLNRDEKIFTSEKKSLLKWLKKIINL
ncbi:MAG: hypothetical protein UT48_C0001G0029 [Parcubacteria group bacterium GW2011_GWE2_39_37]|uniref:Uncharacterized protein n=1 Tax=Candidatus Falkowbacteria bacterium GW2011_GWF2_39_8 TaxID=1618642 RepID=A0A0G0PZ74_9BACT|nr:MAG: hypothetical protein UT48_C0001G0029 [Parcubacteria group bacterium GW2011_GWE2_39_37]KKR33228.1 MAG: hypothetical protein UT64_C0012G0020 [Candidatus Falkowbacteria bacterium GW2011_GWF2_39_8]